ncbi:MAG: LysR family transcriptional regulator [Roseibium sp.]|uniref:LysR family transcriptional regulator n=1 Tax=Roseibium sp. TaxID=1936156 RepID=UPI00260378C3|nr:LysR family transcriptional regulator [Roseibium sp.]MCV0428686.1 LysR family transcriptional regulator [Roseibium sp.]
MNITSEKKFASPVHFYHSLNSDRMREFLAVVREESISGAARTLNLPRATLSRRISALEADLGVRLLHRRTNRLTLTEAGEELRLRAQRIVEDVTDAWNAVRRLDGTPRGLLRVSVTGPHFTRLFTDFLCDYPEVRLEVQSTTRHVDLLSEGIDVAIRIGPVKDQNLIARRLHTDRLVAVASPAYLSWRGTPKTPENLADHNCIVGFAGEWTPSKSWPLLAGGSVPVGGRLSANEIELVTKTALDGIGIALLPSAIAAEHLRSGALTAVLADIVGAEIPVSLVYADREFMDPKVRIFIDRAVEAIAREMPRPYDF